MAPIILINVLGRSPHGERGLKFFQGYLSELRFESLPARGAWIEIERNRAGAAIPAVAPRTGSVD